ncbi:porin [Magnetospirillum aberrantis]|uniref:Porin n=1 Tax=Magnetospirillum aberrantis SpK TaxID=908842 RepID=A0A7C9QRQ5_9PROT|nr:porin [Magnetospirillum aberrantis]NFV78521.1 porin [Magnetospirillum aberrantis SpK]
MKKILVASTALVAASMLSTGAASASEKIKLELGGFSKWWVVGAWQDDSYQANNNGTAGAQGDYNSVDIKGDNEIFFSGSTTLDNGMQVGINVELEAGGTTDNTADTIDKSNVFIAGGFGKVILGSEANGTVLLHVMAPDAAGNTDSDGLLTGGLAIAKPDAVQTQVVTSIDTDGDSEGVTYVAPTFYGLTLGASYKPNSTQDNRGATNISTNSGVTAGEIYGVGGLYTNTFSGVDFKLSGGWATYDVNSPAYSTPSKGQGVNEYAFGTQIGYAGFTVGGSYRKINAEGVAGFLQGDTWDAGVQYASGPYAVSFVYFNSQAEGSITTAGEDEFTVYQVSGKYTLGAGVDVLATVGHAEYSDETNLQQNENKGWMVATGLSLQF